MAYITELEADSLVKRTISKLPETDWRRKYVVNHIRRFIITLQNISIAKPGQVAIDVGTEGFSIEWLKEVFGYEEVFGTKYAPSGNPRLNDNNIASLDIEKDEWPFKDDSCDFALFLEVVEHFTYDPIFPLLELRRVLKHNALMLITTPNAASLRCLKHLLEGRPPQNYYLYRVHGTNDRHHFEYTPNVLRELVESAGFEILDLHTIFDKEPPNRKLIKVIKRAGYCKDDRGNRIVLLAKNSRKNIIRYPEQLYH